MTDISKGKPSHSARQAFIYVRQSSVSQVEHILARRGFAVVWRASAVRPPEPVDELVRSQQSGLRPWLRAEYAVGEPAFAQHFRPTWSRPRRSRRRRRSQPGFLLNSTIRRKANRGANRDG